MINRNLIQDLLTADMIYRKNIEWPLITYNDIWSLHVTKYNYFSSNKIDDSNDMLICECRDDCILAIEEDVYNNIRTSFPLLDILLSRFPLIAAGGAIFKATRYVIFVSFYL